MALRRRTAGGDGASRSRSAGVGRGGGAKTGVSARWFLRAWSGPQAVSSVRRAQWPAGPSQEAGYVCQSVGVGVLEPTGGRGEATRTQAPAESPRRASLPAPSAVRTVLIHSGWEKLDKPSGGFFKGGEGGKARDQLWLQGNRSGQGLAAESCPGHLSFPDTRWLGWPFDSAVLPPSRGGGKPARETSGQRETDPPVESCPGRDAVSDTLPGLSAVRTVLIYSGREELDEPSRGLFQGGRGEKSRGPPRAPRT